MYPTILEQYRNRAQEAIKIYSIPRNTDIEKRAKLIALAELTQILFFVIQTILYSLAFSGVISTQIAGIVVFSLIPIEGICAYHTFVHYKSCSRIVLTLASLFALSGCAGLALFGTVTDSAISMGGGGIILHLFRNISERVDTQRALQQVEYRREVLGEAAPNERYQVTLVSQIAT